MDSAQMADDVPHPYSIELSPMTKPEGHFQWAIRKSGKLSERSDRPHRSEAKAHESAMAGVLGADDRLPSPAQT
jgi:hypothetical protein